MCRFKNADVTGYAEAFRPVQSDSQTSEWYSYFKNDVLIFIERQGLRNVKPCFFIQGHGREIFRGHLKFNGLEAFLG